MVMGWGEIEAEKNYFLIGIKKNKRCFKKKATGGNKGKVRREALQ